MKRIVLLLSAALLVSCGGGGGASNQPTSSHTKDESTAKLTRMQIKQRINDLKLDDPFNSVVHYDSKLPPRREVSFYPDVPAEGDPMPMKTYFETLVEEIGVARNDINGIADTFYFDGAFFPNVNVHEETKDDYEEKYGPGAYSVSSTNSFFGSMEGEEILLYRKRENRHSFGGSSGASSSINEMVFDLDKEANRGDMFTAYSIISQKNQDDGRNLEGKSIRKIDYEKGVRASALFYNTSSGDGSGREYALAFSIDKNEEGNWGCLSYYVEFTGEGQRMYSYKYEVRADNGFYVYSYDEIAKQSDLVDLVLNLETKEQLASFGQALGESVQSNIDQLAATLPEETDLEGLQKMYDDLPRARISVLNPGLDVWRTYDLEHIDYYELIGSKYSPDIPSQGVLLDTYIVVRINDPLGDDTEFAKVLVNGVELEDKIDDCYIFLAGKQTTYSIDLVVAW